MRTQNTTCGGYVYLIGSSLFGWYKIGKTRSPHIRSEQLGILLPFKVELFTLWRTANCSTLENLFHARYEKFRINGEWFAFKPKHVVSILQEAAPFDGVLEFGTPINGRKIASSSIEFDVFHLGQDIHGVSLMQKKIRTNVVWTRMREYMADNDLPNTKEGRLTALAAVRRATPV